MARQLNGTPVARPDESAMRTTSTFGRLVALILVLAMTGPPGLAFVAKDPPGLHKLDKALREKVKNPRGLTRIIVRGTSGVSSNELDEIVGRLGGGTAGPCD